MKRINILIIITVILVCLGSINQSNAQQYSEYTQYMFNPVVFNPAYTGSKGLISMRAIYRNQWTGLNGAPQTINFGIHSPFRESNAAIGLWLENDQLGFTNTTRVNGTFAYHIPMGKAKLSIGLNGGITNWNVNYDEDPNSLNYDQGVESYSLISPSVGAGLWFYTERFYLGVSSTDLLENDRGLENSGGLAEEMHFYATTGLVIPIGRSLKFKPTAFLKFVEDTPQELDLTAHFLFRETLWLGVAWSSTLGDETLVRSDSIDLLAEIQLTAQLVAGYSYDLTNSEIKAHDIATHEIMLGYDFCYSRNKIVTPRYF